MVRAIAARHLYLPKYNEIGLIKRSQFQISQFATNDSYQEVLRWFLDNDWNIFVASHDKWYRFTKEETISEFYPEIRLVYYIDIQPSGNNQTCIIQVAYASVVVLDGKVIHRSQDYLDVGSDYYHHAPDCPLNAHTVP